MNYAFKLLAVLTAAAVFAPDATAAYEEIEVTNGGMIVGNVDIGSARPRTARKIVSKNVEVCGEGTREVPLVRANGEALLDAVVYLDRVPRGKPFPAATKKITINQKRCAFDPYLSVLAEGGELEAVNSDPILHNIHTYEVVGPLRRTVMNVSQPEFGNIVTKKISLPEGVGMRVECDAHNFMLGFVFVARNPYFAVVDHRGRFEIRDVPPGKYTIRVWHGVLGNRKAKISVRRADTTSITFAY